MFRNRGTALEDLGGLAMHAILSRLSSTDVASLACVNTKLRVSASSDDVIWSKFCADELDLTAPVDHLGNIIPTFKETYKRWKEAFSMYPWSLVVRTKKCWDRIKIWFSDNIPKIFATLRRGASEDELTNLENQLNVKLPLPARLLYRFCDGQLFTEMEDESILESWSGLIGGYVLFDLPVHVLLFSVRQVMEGTIDLLRNIDFHNKSKYILVASSSVPFRKYFVLDCDTGLLFVGTRNMNGKCKMLPCIPKSLIINSIHDRDGMLVWLEEHYRRIESGTLGLRWHRNKSYLSQFPNRPPFCTTTLVNGVRVQVSAILVPELSNHEDNRPEYMFAYSIRVSLLPRGCFVNGMHFRTCQLQKRSWTILTDDGVIFNSNCESEIGKYPLLSCDEGEFVYQSGYPFSSPSGSMEGSFTFVPGSLAIPGGAPFEVKVEQFPVKFDFIF